MLRESRSWTSPQTTRRGVDLFAAFEGENGYCHNIQVNRAMPGLALVESEVRAPAAILALLNPEFHSYTTSSGGFFTKNCDPARGHAHRSEVLHDCAQRQHSRRSAGGAGPLVLRNRPFD